MDRTRGYSLVTRETGAEGGGEGVKRANRRASLHEDELFTAPTRFYGFTINPLFRLIGGVALPEHFAAECSRESLTAAILSSTHSSFSQARKLLLASAFSS